MEQKELNKVFEVIVKTETSEKSKRKIDIKGILLWSIFWASAIVIWYVAYLKLVEVGLIK